MTTQEQIQRIQQEIQVKQDHIAFLKAHEEFFDKNEIHPTFGYGTIDFDRPDHTTATKIMRHFKMSRWSKDYDEDKITYVSAERNGIQLRVWRSAPPDSCKLIAYDEVVPAQMVEAHTVRKFKLQCKGDAVVETL